MALIRMAQNVKLQRHAAAAGSHLSRGLMCLKQPTDASMLIEAMFVET